MTKLLAFAACVAALVAALAWPGNADPAGKALRPAGEAATDADVDANLRRSGLTPDGPIRRNRDVFVTHAIDPQGTKVRVVADALFGDIVSVAPAQRPPIYAVRYDAGPRIIHIPQRGGEHASLPDEDDHDAMIDEDAAAPLAAAPPARRYRQPPQAHNPRHEPHRELHREPRRKPYQESRRPEPPSRISARAPAPAAPPVELKANRSVLAIPPEPVKAQTPPPPPATPRWQAARKFSPPADAAAPPPLAATPAAPTVPAAEAAQASANEPAAVVAPIAPDHDMPPDGITADPAH